MARTACLVCFISTVNGHCYKKKKRKEKKKLSLGRPVLVEGTQQTLSNLFWDFRYLWWSLTQRKQLKRVFQLCRDSGERMNEHLKEGNVGHFLLSWCFFCRPGRRGGRRKWISWGQFVEQRLMLSSSFRCDQIDKIRYMILVTLCCAT